MKEVVFVKKCADCGANTFVINSWVLKNGLVMRRRACHKCGYQFVTAEIEESLIDLEALGGKE